MIGARISASSAGHRRPSFRALRSWSVFAAPGSSGAPPLEVPRAILDLGEALVPQLAEFVAGLHWTIDILVPCRWAQAPQ